MPEEGFLRRWARVKASGDDAAAEAPPRAPAPAAPAARPGHAPTPWSRAGDTQPPAPAAPAAPADAAPATDTSAVAGRPSPTLEDVAQLTPDSDYSVFVGQGVDKSVQRLALKKLFADPHFNAIDRLDMYMDDYNIPSPVSEAMLASLDHARSALRRFVEEPAATATAADPDTAAAMAPVPADGDVRGEPVQAARSAEPATPPAAGEHQADLHNEAAHATAAHETTPPGETPGVFPPRAPTHEHGPFDRPNQQLPQGQA